MKHLTGWRLSAAAVGTAAVAAGAFGLPAILSNDTTDPAPIEITTVGGTGGSADDPQIVPGADPDIATDDRAEASAPTSASAGSTTSLVSAASNGSPISLNSPDGQDEPDDVASTASSGGGSAPAPAAAVVDSEDSPSSADSPSLIDSPSSLDS